MPKVDMDQETGTVIEWLKREGDQVEKGEIILVIETDKVAIEVESPGSGFLRGIRAEPGEVVPIATTIAYILEPGEELPKEEAPAATEAVATSLPPAATERTSDSPPVTPVARRMATSEGIDLSEMVGSGPGGKITRQDVERHLAERGVPAGDGKVRATPAARRAAREHRVDLSQVNGSGPRGRVQEADVLAILGRLAAQPHAPADAPIQPGEPEIIPLEGMRGTIARRLQASYQDAPHVMFTLDVDMTNAIAFREYANQRVPEGQLRISMTALIVKACAWTLRQHPLVNSHLIDDTIHMLPNINVGVAVALEQGLIVPVVHNADQKGLMQVGAEVADLAERARAGRLRPKDMTDASFTLSNLGMFGIDHFTAIINPPQVGILAVGRIAKRFVPDENDQPVARPTMTVTLAVDHRVVDGALAARFVTTLRDALEEPASIVL
jgi:pyruvate dehydrogenase E2 component (dihydrolipoamide acetyltransferase)